MDILEKVHSMPQKPGVYIFKKNGVPIYIGKAKRLKSRVSSYFSNRAIGKATRISSSADDIDYIVLSNEREALLMEANLIYAHKPRFNTLLKETHAYPYVRFRGGDFPYIEITHEKTSDSIGPFTSVSFLRNLINIIQPVLQFRTCTYDLTKVKRPCFEYHIKRCSAPCMGLVSKEEYGERIRIARAFLMEGDAKKIKAWMRKRIEAYAKQKMFESAEVMKRMYERLNNFLVTQSVEFQEPIDVDAVDVREGGAVLVKVRNGMMLAKLEFELKGGYKDFIARYYMGRGETPAPVILVGRNFRGIKTWSKRISSIVRIPENESERDILSIASKNLDEYLNGATRMRRTLEELKEKLGLSKLPELIEGIDISHTAGTLTVASVVVFVKGRPSKEHYRRYRLSNFSKPDDFEAMRQVIKRRYPRHSTPDLLLIDGGKGQVNAVVETLRSANLDNVHVVGLAKEDERIVFPGKQADLHLSMDDNALRLLIAVRDESHRFATSYHYLLRGKKMTESFLDSISGIGPKRKRALLKAFKSLKGIRRASHDELKKIVGEKMAEKIESIFSQGGIQSPR